jgi:hypothetical protein
MIVLLVTKLLADNAALNNAACKEAGSCLQ